MIRRLPVLPTIVVLGAVALLIGLGCWQLSRGHQKDRLLAQYAQAESLPPIAFPTGAVPERSLPLFRHATGVCQRVIGNRAQAGENAAGEPGYVHIVDCARGSAAPMSVELGWSKNPNVRFDWRGGPVSGIIAPDRKNRMRLVAASAPPGLEPSAAPSLGAIPNNHRSYAVQWFSFAAIALIIYGLAVRKRLKEEQPPR